MPSDGTTLIYALVHVVGLSGRVSRSYGRLNPIVFSGSISACVTNDGMVRVLYYGKVAKQR